MGLFDAKIILVEDPKWYYLTHCREDNKIHTFSKSISSKVSVIAQLEFKIVYFKTAVQHFSRYAMGSPRKYMCICYFVYIFTNPSAQARCDTRSIF